MSKIVTFDQAKKLKELGFEEETSKEYRTPVVRIFEGGKAKFVEREPDVYDTGKHASFYGDVSYDNYIPAPFIPEALDFIREEKEIACGVYPMHHGYLPNKNPDIHYGFNFYFLEDEKVKMTYSDRYKSHLLAESALLDAVLDYLEKK